MVYCGCWCAGQESSSSPREHSRTLLHLLLLGIHSPSQQRKSHSTTPSLGGGWGRGNMDPSSHYYEKKTISTQKVTALDLNLWKELIWIDEWTLVVLDHWINNCTPPPPPPPTRSFQFALVNNDMDYFCLNRCNPKWEKLNWKIFRDWLNKSEKHIHWLENCGLLSLYLLLYCAKI